MTILVENNSDTRGDNTAGLEAVRFLQAFVECGADVQELVLEMAAIVSDDSSTEDERLLALDAMTEALFPGTAADVIELHKKCVHTPTAVEAAKEIETEERTFAERIRDLMDEKGVTQQDLATAAGIGQPAVSNILNRQCRPQGRTVQKFAEALGVEPTDLWPSYRHID